MHDLKARQHAFNVETRDHWNAFAGHRAKVTGLLATETSPGKSRLCVLGAGKCNDLDLATLLQAHSEVHLVDLDAEALTRGSVRQGVAGHPSLRTYGGVDVTGMLNTIATWSPQTSIGPEDLVACADGAVRCVGPSLPGPFDHVASTCLLSQLIGSVVTAVGEEHPRFGELVPALRAGHLRLMANLTAAGGAAALITDIVSSETFPALGSVPEASLAGLLTQLARDRNFFHGVNPAALWSVVARDTALNAELVGPDTVPPWRWDLGPRLHLVWALRWRKRA
jgi:hypothetical protein